MWSAIASCAPAVKAAHFKPLYFRAADGDVVLAWAEVELSERMKVEPPKDPGMLPNEGDVIIF